MTADSANYNPVSDEEKIILFNAMWQDSIAGIALVEEDGTFMHVNPAFCKIVEYTEAELRKIDYQTITVPEDVDPDVNLAAQVAAGQIPSYDMIKSYISKTRRLVWVHLKVVFIPHPFKKDEKGNPAFRYFLSQIVEIPYTTISSLGVDPTKPSHSFIVSDEEMKRASTKQPWWYKPPEIPWKVIMNWLPFVLFIFGSVILGALWLLGFLVLPTPPPV